MISNTDSIRTTLTLDFRRWKECLTVFLFPAESVQWIAILRIGLGTVVVFYCVSLANDWHYLLARTRYGLIGRELAEAVISSESVAIPNVGWLVYLGQAIGIPEAVVVSLILGALLLSASLLIVGLFSRWAAITAWFLHLCAVKSGDLLIYGVDNFITIGLFYLMICPLPGSWSLDRRIWKPRASKPELVGFFRRVLQLHLCLVYFFGGLTKCLGSGWWDGSNVWRALIRPPFNVIDPNFLIRWRYLFPVMGISFCLLEIGYPVLIWSKKARPIWLVGILVMHIAIGLTMGMYLFGLIMVVLNVAAFGPGSGLTANFVESRLTHVRRRVRLTAPQTQLE
jgi:hypothetical protein